MSATRSNAQNQLYCRRSILQMPLQPLLDLSQGFSVAYILRALHKHPNAPRTITKHTLWHHTLDQAGSNKMPSALTYLDRPVTALVGSSKLWQHVQVSKNSYCHQGFEGCDVKLLLPSYAQVCHTDVVPRAGAGSRATQIPTSMFRYAMSTRHLQPQPAAVSCTHTCTHSPALVIKDLRCEVSSDKVHALTQVTGQDILYWQPNEQAWRVYEWHQCSSPWTHFLVQPSQHQRTN